MWVDFTERNRMEQALAARSQQLQTILDNTPVCVAISVKGTYRLVNPRMTESLGVNVGDKAALVYADPEDRNRLIHMLEREGIVRNYETRFIGASGDLRDMLFTLQSTDFEGEKGVLGWAIDVTDLKAIQTELATATESADAANQAKSEFLANMSHELRTPMNAVLGYSEMLMEDAEDVGQDDFIPDLKKINQAGNHLLSFINDVLDLSKIESGKMEAFAETFDIGALIDQVSGTAQPLMTKNNNRFRIERGDDLGNANQDITKLRQSLLNLLSNAAKFTHEGTITPQAEREGIDGVDWLTFAVNDTGIGIPEDKLEHVFEEFSQADSSTTRDYGGTGLGLTISRRFCQMLGGDMTVSSELGVGSTFTIRLPAELPGSEMQQETAPQSAARVDPQSDEIPPTKPGSTILVIDDDAQACEIIQRFLEKDDFNVVTAHGGEQGPGHAVTRWVPLIT